MRIDVISAVPELLLSPLGHSIPKRAQDKGLAEIVVHNLRDYGFGPYRQIDDYPFGGGAGMVLMAEPISTLIDQLKAERDYAEIIYMSPDGQTFNQSLANRLSISGNLIILCGHYKGIDQRIRDRYISLEISMGEFVLSGGEIAAAAVVDAVVRLLPGVLGNEESALSDSFQDGLLAPPLYTRPEEFQGMKVPEVLTSGHHKKIAEWRLEQSLARTAALRPDLLGPEDES
ncbi:MAG: tRNA (guanosine(37)-N1)-methyltransferase TrmD [Bacteroidetes bacterium]|nr:tRNA (guanosine(37)-N1)-methyltransferase TrmD [Bacteroidota bacterium]MDA0944207.1 tRNA (guanosine(37)-N1)-methyltransferase TrmD [Bacteroidota bacterium]MDA1112313.1 tRNA (guanosine(37)-N1)-methyltransferase TrmD [Bacteroidota bacterium]